MEMLLAAAFIYWGMSIVFEIVQMRLEARFGRAFEIGGLPEAPRGRP
jgi:polar amino acid transport system permease protein